MKDKRQNHSSAFKARVALAATKGKRSGLWERELPPAKLPVLSRYDSCKYTNSGSIEYR